MKSLARLALASAALLLASSLVQAQEPVQLSAQAVHVIDSLATTARTQRIETAACLDSFTIAPFAISHLGPASIARADSLSIAARGPGLCAFGVPTLHAHVAKNGVLFAPSDVDLHSKQITGQPFALILVVTDATWLLVLY